jgi:hypothetical protein
MQPTDVELPMPSPSADLAKLDAETLRQRYAETVLLHARTHHVGRANRIDGQIREIGERLVALGGTSERELLPLLKHRSGNVRRSAAYAVRPFDRSLFLSTMEGLVRAGGAIGRKAQSDLEFEAMPREPMPAPDPNWLRIINWQEDNPPPPAMTRSQFEDRVRTAFAPDRARQLLALTRPAIGLWPRRNAGSDTFLGSRHCGDAWAPPGWQWPIYEEEPMYFLGQIYCPDLIGLPGAELLPAEGLLTFFGDFDAIAGCDTAGSVEQGAVYHWPAENLIRAEPPQPLGHPREQKATPLAFRPFIDLPHPGSTIVDTLGLDDAEQEIYWSLWQAVREDGIPEDVVGRCDLASKLLGWPDLVQNDFCPAPQSGRKPHRLLAQLPARLGPGGSLYFFIDEADLARRRFDRCILEEQST